MNNAPTASPAPPASTVAAGGRTSLLPHENGTEIVFPGKVVGNNGKDGLLRMHWARKQALATRYAWLVKAATKARHAGPVRLELIRYSVGRMMDYDNLVSTGKLILDAVVKAGVLPDDNPSIITERHYDQLPAGSAVDQRTVIRITDLPLTGTSPT